MKVRALLHRLDVPKIEIEKSRVVFCLELLAEELLEYCLHAFQCPFLSL